MSTRNFKFSFSLLFAVSFLSLSLLAPVFAGEGETSKSCDATLRALIGVDASVQRAQSEKLTEAVAIFRAAKRLKAYEFDDIGFQQRGLLSDELAHYLVLRMLEEHIGMAASASPYKEGILLAVGLAREEMREEFSLYEEDRPFGQKVIDRKTYERLVNIEETKTNLKAALDAYDRDNQAQSADPALQTLPDVWTLFDLSINWKERRRAKRKDQLLEEALRAALNIRVIRSFSFRCFMADNPGRCCSPSSQKFRCDDVASDFHGRPDNKCAIWSLTEGSAWQQTMDWVSSELQSWVP